MLPLLLALALQTAVPRPVDPCAFDKPALMALTPDRFDQDMEGGWRPIGSRPGCEAAAATLLHDYREAHRSSLTEAELHISYWHEGQMRAYAGETRGAVPFLLAGVSPHGLNDFEDYALGTAAFLLRDRPALASARARLAALPQPADWGETQAEFRKKFGSAPSWPPNLNVLDGLLACFEKPYAKAYAPPCNTGGFRVTKPLAPKP